MTSKSSLDRSCRFHVPGEWFEDRCCWWGARTTRGAQYVHVVGSVPKAAGSPVQIAVDIAKCISVSLRLHPKHEGRAYALSGTFLIGFFTPGAGPL